jgi:hypothetical protein
MEKPGSEREGIKELLQAIAAESETLRLFKEDPGQLADRFGFDEGRVAALRSARILIAADCSECTFGTGTTLEV